MLRIMHNGGSGMASQVLRLEVLANNLANVQTTAFKARRVTFADLNYQNVARPGMPVYAARAPVQVGSGVKVAEITPAFTQAPLVETGQLYDVAIAGKGFLAVELPTGEMAYTRDGHLRLSPEGYLVHAGSGYPLAGRVSVPEEAQAVAIRPDGRVMARLADGTEEEVGQIQLYTFPNPQGLVAYGQNLWLASELSGAPQAGPPGQDGLGKLVPGMLEVSNVDVAEQMVEMLLAQRAYQLNARSVLTGDEMWALANDLRR